MSRYASAQPMRESEISTAPKVPTQCGCSGCESDADVVHVIVRDERGRERSGWWSNFARGKSLKDGYTFVAWAARCTDHYLRDLYAARRGVNSPISGTSVMLTEEAVDAHWAKLDAAHLDRALHVEPDPHHEMRMEERK